MSIRNIALGGLAFLLVIGLSPGHGTALAQTPEQTPSVQQTTTAQETPPAQTTTEAQTEQAETMSCSDCHDQPATFATNPHGAGKAVNGTVPNAVCESCHGNGQAHMEAGGDTSLIVKPVGQTGANICLECHDTVTNAKARKDSVHANSATVNCLTCHSIHHSPVSVPHLLVKKQLDLCSSCHQTQAAGFRNKPYSHHIGRGGLECSSCHEPHAPALKKNLRLTRAGETPCLECHSEKRGPYVFPHDAVALGECTTCHELHGSNNPRQLKRTNVFQLCLECHSPITTDTLGSQPPSFHNISSPRYQNCTTCHVAIHGSNRSPQLLK
ncbi:MAG: DmsE family decaheme c-type cytochrome [Thermoanaerobaculia bacterium]